MKKIRLLFMVVILLVFVGSLVILNTFQAPLDSNIETISEFKITKISGPGTVYTDKSPIIGKDFSAAKPVDIRTMNHSEDMYLKADPQTSFEFLCFGTSFTVLPDSYLHYHPGTNEFYFYNGEYFWNKEIEGKKLEISIANKSEEGSESPPKLVTLSDAGKFKIAADLIEIWNYSGNLKLDYENQAYELKSNQMLTWELKKKPPIQIFDLLPGPEFIAPENKVISVDKPEDAVVNFSWKAVRGSRNYILRLYSSDLKENLLEEWMVSTTSRTINLQKYEEFNEFFWQVYPYDDDNQREGVPSKIGYVELSGLLQGKEKVLTPPRLVITSLTVSGNMVLIKGEADINSELFINGRLVSINMDGTFIDTMNFESMGKKIIHFRLVAPTEIETNITRQVTIFDE